MPARRDLGPERRRDLLCAEAYPQRRQVGGKSGFENLALFGQEWIGVGLVDADRPAQHDQQIGQRRIERPEFMHAEIVIMNPVAGGRQHGLETSEILEMDVPDGDRRFQHGGGSPRHVRSADRRQVGAVVDVIDRAVDHQRRDRFDASVPGF